jgi:hypothetical protein
MDGGADGQREAAREQTPPVSGEARPPAQKSALVEEAARVAATLNDKLPMLSPEPAASRNHKAAPERESLEAREGASHSRHNSQTFEREGGDEESVTESATETAEVQADAPRGRMRQRAVSVGASVGENLRPRVEKLREASTVVFDEATDDPGLRFVIVAALLFLVFIFIFILSYILG